jgi:hypothetical protein
VRTLSYQYSLFLCMVSRPSDTHCARARNVPTFRRIRIINAMCHLDCARILHTHSHLPIISSACRLLDTSISRRVAQITNAPTRLWTLNHAYQPCHNRQMNTNARLNRYDHDVLSLFTVSYRRAAFMSFILQTDYVRLGISMQNNRCTQRTVDRKIREET